MMKLLKITNPNWLKLIAPRINDYAKYLKKLHIKYENLLSAFEVSIQNAHLQNTLEYDLAEFWVVLYEDKPTAFAHWYRKSLPHIGKVQMDAIYSWSKSPNAVSMLIDQFIEFGKQHRSTIYEADCLDEKLYRLFRKYANEKGIDWQDTGLVHCIGLNKGVKK